MRSAVMMDDDIDRSSFQDNDSFEELDFDNGGKAESSGVDRFLESESAANQMHIEQMNIKDEEIRILQKEIEEQREQIQNKEQTITTLNAKVKEQDEKEK